MLIDEGRVRGRVTELAREISADHRDADELLVVGVLKGAFVFVADLARQLRVEHRVDFVTVSSYRDATRPGELRLVQDVEQDPDGRHVLIVDDVIDSGATLSFLRGHLAARRAASVGCCVLLRKPGGRALALDYVGFDVDDVWVVGYGLDHAGRHRSLPFVGKL